jgi:hypothetical protein
MTCPKPHSQYITKQEFKPQQSGWEPTAIVWVWNFPNSPCVKGLVLSLVLLGDDGIFRKQDLVEKRLLEHIREGDVGILSFFLSFSLHPG